MIRNYLKIALRNLRKSKLFSSINVFGLSVGMACCMLLLLYITSELSFDRHHEFANDIYLLRSENTYNGELMDNPRAPSPYAQAMKAEFPEVVQVTRVWQNFLEKETLLRVEDSGRTLKAFNEKSGYQVDSTFFDVFTYQFSEGTPAHALDDAHTVVLSEAVAQKLFGTEPALNKTIRIGGVAGSNENFRVTGVYHDESARSHIAAPYFLSIQAGWVGSFLREQKAGFPREQYVLHLPALATGYRGCQIRKQAAHLREQVRAEGLEGVRHGEENGPAGASRHSFI